MSLIPRTRVTAAVVEHRRCHGSCVASSAARRRLDSLALPLPCCTSDSTEQTPPTGSELYVSNSSVKVKAAVNGAEESPLPPGAEKRPSVSCTLVGHELSDANGATRCYCHGRGTKLEMPCSIVLRARLLLS